MYTGIMGQAEPLVSVVSITYNHEQFISQMIEGVLMQQTTFPIELILAEDRSTDRTRDIILEYQKMHPELIRIIMSESNIGAVDNEKRAMFAARWKYIAICEGDDYWTDPLKLQKQVDFLESNPDFSVCFHRCKHHNLETNEWYEDQANVLFGHGSLEGIEITTEMFFKHWITQPLSIVFRKDAFDLDLIQEYSHYRDMHLIYHLLQKGRGYLFSFFGGVYNVHYKSMFNQMGIIDKCIQGVNIADELFKVNKSELLKKNLCNVLQWAICEMIKNNHKKLVPKYILMHLYYSLKFKRFYKNVQLALHT